MIDRAYICDVGINVNLFDGLAITPQVICDVGVNVNLFDGLLNHATNKVICIGLLFTNKDPEVEYSVLIASHLTAAYRLNFDVC